jgi:SAM-dependent methyltransferase
MNAADLIRIDCPICRHGESRPERTVAGYGLERCRDCGFVFVNPQPSEEELTRIYAVRDVEELIRLYSRIQNADVERQQDRILDLLERYLPNRGRLLDFGCGAGYFAERAARRGWQASGIELGHWCREAAQRRGFENVFIGSLADGVFPPGHFDIVCANQVLEHLPNPRQTLTQIHAVIRPGGFFYANVPNYRCLSILLGKDDFEHNTPPQHLNYFTPRSFTQLLKSAGLNVRLASTYGGLKWENLVGCRTKSTITAAYDAPLDSAPAREPRPAARESFLKRLIRPPVDLLFYGWAKVGIALEAVAKRPLV